MKLIILDRDGVINYDSADYIRNASEWRALPGSLEAIAQLTQNGYTVVVCTNQSGIGRHLFTLEDLEQIHNKMQQQVEECGGSIAAIFFCPHVPSDNCACRKPRPQMIFDICRQFKIDNIADVMMVGDSQRDLVAIDTAGGIPILVKTGSGEKTLSAGNAPEGTLVFDDLLAVCNYLLKIK